MNIIYDNILNDDEIKNIYDEIERLEDEKKEWSYHNFDHVMNVIKIVENILKSLGFDSDFIYKAKLACLLHDVGVTGGKDNHAYRSYLFANDYFKTNNISFDGMDKVLEAIKIHSDGFNTDNEIALALVLADKLDVRKTRIPKTGKSVVGNRQYAHVEDVTVNVNNNILTINFVTDHDVDMKEINEYYFTKKIFKAVESFAKKFDLDYKILMDKKEWKL